MYMYIYVYVYKGNSMVAEWSETEVAKIESRRQCLVPRQEEGSRIQRIDLDC